jgi:uncharacterized protein (TIGR02246 family)
MRTLWLLTLALHPVVPGSAATLGAPAAALDPAIVHLADAYLDAVRAGDAQAVAAFFTQDGIEMPPCQPPVEGRGAIERYHRAFFNGPAKLQQFSFGHRETRSSGDTAFDVGTYRQTLSAGPTGTVEDRGKYVVLLRREGGDWRVAYMIYTSDLPPAGPGAPPAGR